MVVVVVGRVPKCRDSSVKIQCVRVCVCVCVCMRACPY